MKIRATLCVLVLATVAAGKDGRRARSYVPDATTAGKIAEAVLIPVYGEKQIASERPFRATLKDEVWTVEGTLHCSDGKGGTTTMCLGGTAVVKLSKLEGRILFMMHYK